MNRWRIYQDGYPEYSQEVKDYANNSALTAAMAKNADGVDIDLECINRLGRHWASHFLFDYKSLECRYGENIDALMILADRMDIYCTVYEAALQHAAKLTANDADESKAGPPPERTCGTLVAQHFDTACRNELLVDMPAKTFPGTSDILEAISLNRIMLASLCIDDDVPKALNLLSDAMSAKFLYTQSDMKIGSIISLKKERKAKAKKIADAGHNQPGGSRDKRNKIKLAWSSGAYKSRDECAQKESSKIGMSLSTARKALIGTPDPA